MKQQVNPVVAVVIILAVVVGVGWLIYDNTQARMVDLPTTQAQRLADTRQKMEGMRAGMAAMSRKSKSANHTTAEPKSDAKTGPSPKQAQSAEKND